MFLKPPEWIALVNCLRVEHWSIAGGDSIHLRAAGEPARLWWGVEDWLGVVSRVPTIVRTMVNGGPDASVIDGSTHQFLDSFRKPLTLGRNLAETSCFRKKYWSFLWLGEDQPCLWHRVSISIFVRTESRLSWLMPCPSCPSTTSGIFHCWMLGQLDPSITGTDVSGSTVGWGWTGQPPISPPFCVEADLAWPRLTL